MPPDIKKRRLDQVDVSPPATVAAANGSNPGGTYVAPESSFVGSLVTFVVGPSKVTYEVHNQVLSSIGCDLPTSLPECQPETFDIFLRWAYAKFAGVQDLGKTMLDSLTGAQLLDLYVLARSAKIRLCLTDAIATCVFFRARKANMAWQAMGLTKEALGRYAGHGSTDMDNLLMHLIVQACLTQGDARPLMEDLLNLPRNMQRPPIWTLYKQQELWARDPDAVKCYYHEHLETEPCQDGWSA